MYEEKWEVQCLKSTYQRVDLALKGSLLLRIMGMPPTLALWGVLLPQMQVTQIHMREHINGKDAR